MTRATLISPAQYLRKCPSLALKIYIISRWPARRDPHLKTAIFIIVWSSPLDRSIAHVCVIRSSKTKKIATLLHNTRRERWLVVSSRQSCINKVVLDVFWIILFEFLMIIMTQYFLNLKIKSSSSLCWVLLKWQVSW